MLNQKIDDMYFSEDDISSCTKLFLDNKSTKEVQDYLLNKYPNLRRSKTSNFVKMIRKKFISPNSAVKGG